MYRAYEFRLYPNRTQVRHLGEMIETHRRLYNSALAQRKDAWEAEQTSVKYKDQSSWFKGQRSTNTWFANINFSSAQATLRRLDKAFQSFFRRIKTGEKPGYPRFSNRDKFSSVEFPSHGDGVRLFGNRLRVQHVGVVRVCLHRPTEGEIKTIRIVRRAEKWFVIATCLLPDVATISNGKPDTGIDLGLENFLTASDGFVVESPRFQKHELPALRVAQRAVSRKKKGGSNRRKAGKFVARIHERVANLRKDFHRKVALDLTRRYGFIGVENLTIKNMVKSHLLARAIHDAGWAGFVVRLEHKAASAGVQVVKVNPRGTSQECSKCGAVVPKKLGDRTHRCSCGYVAHRDLNAAKNILARARLVRTEPVEVNTCKGICSPRSRRLQATE